MALDGKMFLGFLWVWSNPIVLSDAVYVSAVSVMCDSISERWSQAEMRMVEELGSHTMSRIEYSAVIRRWERGLNQEWAF